MGEAASPHTATPPMRARACARGWFSEPVAGPKRTCGQVPGGAWGSPRRAGKRLSLACGARHGSGTALLLSLTGARPPRCQPGPEEPCHSHLSAEASCPS
jgi:hypothetical protein